MTDDLANKTYDLEAFRVKVSKDDAAKVAPGAKVKVTAQLQRFYKEATEDKEEIDLAETVEGGSLEIIAESAVENIFSGAKSVKRIEDGQIVIYRNGVRYNLLGSEVR